MKSPSELRWKSSNSKLERRTFTLPGVLSLFVLAFIISLVIFVLISSRSSGPIFLVLAVSSIPLLLFLGIAAATLIGSGFFARDIRLRLGGMKLSINELFPFVRFVGSIFKISNGRLEKSFIDLHNRIAARGTKTHRPSELLLLLPRCIQYLGCPEKVILDYRNCKACGNCEIGNIVALCDSKGIKLQVATGGELARRLVKETNPGAIVAVGCERELLGGIKDTEPIPSLVIVNERPEGPCRNTKVDLKQVEEAVSVFIGGN